MKTYSVLMTTSQYVLVKADSAQEASQTAWLEYRKGMHPISEYPEFTCEECDVEDDQEEQS